MDKTKLILSSNQDTQNEFEYYFSIIEIAEASVDKMPDITIDCCKSLIEGISKSILISLDSNYEKNNQLVNGVKTLKIFDKAIKIITQYNNSINGKETDFLVKSRDLVETIINIRNDRGDISHGKYTPKPPGIVSTSEFGLFVLNMTDCILSFMLKIFFEIKISSTGILRYDVIEMEAYNSWLDDSIEFPIKKARYSKLLYENDYDEYESRYSDEFLRSKEDGEEDVDKLEIAETTKEKIIDAKEAEKTAPVSQPILPQIEKLVNNFDDSTFWTQASLQSLKNFSKTENLKTNQLKVLINDYLFTEKPPLRDEVAQTMNVRPKLSEFKQVTSLLSDRIIEFANELNNIKT